MCCSCAESAVTDCRDAVIHQANLVSNQSLCTDVRRDLSGASVVQTSSTATMSFIKAGQRWISSCLYLVPCMRDQRTQSGGISDVLHSPLLWAFSAVCKWTSMSPLAPPTPRLVIWLRLCQWIWAVFTVKAFISVLAGECLLNNQSIAQPWSFIKP